MKAALYLRVANDDQSEALSQQEFYLRQHRTIWQEHSAKDFASYESYKRAGILYVFPPFITARMGQKIGRRPQTQLCGAALRAWAKKQGYEVTSAFQDVTPGTSLDRPGLQALLSELRSKQFDVILVKGAERLIRNFRLVPQLAETFRRAGVRVISPLDTNDIFGTTPSVLTALNAE